jgi:hypothetical protein
MEQQSRERALKPDPQPISAGSSYNLQQKGTAD